MKNSDIQITTKCQQGRSNQKNALIVRICGKITGYIQPIIMDFDRQHYNFVAYNIEKDEFVITCNLWDAEIFCGIPKELDPELPNGCYNEFFDWKTQENDQTY